MIFIQFPITGDLRLPLLIMEWIYIITGFQISFYFLIRYFKQEKSLRNLQDCGYSSVFFGFSLMWVFYIIGDYYSSENIISPFFIWNQGSVRTLFLNIGYFAVTIGVFFLLLSVEKYDVFLFRRYFFTFIFSISSILFFILFFIDIRITQPITYVFWISFIAFFAIYLIKFLKRLKKKGILLFIGIVFMLIGFLLTTDALIEMLGLEGRMVGAILQLLSVIILSYFFSILPPFSEFDWQEKIEAVFLINEAGLCLYYKAFSNKKEFINENLISVAISSMYIMLQELTKSGEGSKGISVIKKEGENIIISHGNFVKGVLYTSEELNFPKIVLKNFVEKFETLYHNILKDWKGDVNQFKPIETVANDLFLK